MAAAPQTAPVTDLPTVVRHPRRLYVLFWVAFPPAGAGLGWLLARSADWLARHDWLPFHGFVDWAAELPRTPTMAVAVAVGALAGLLLAWAAAAEAPAVELDHHGVRLVRGAQSRAVPGPVRGAFVDSGRLVLLGPHGAERTREKTDLSVRDLAEAFRAHGVAWYDTDPYAGDYRRWVPGLPDLPTGADALLRARAKAVGEDDGADADQLREELLRLGVAVRDEGERQFYRLFDPD